MKDTLRGLVKLQELMRDAVAQAAQIAAVPAAIARLEKDLLEVQKKVEQEKIQLDELQKDRRKLESDLMGVEAKIQKYQGQLSEVKTNREYQAMLHEIEGCKTERASLDEKILLEMEESEQHSDAFKKVEERLQAKRRETEEGKNKLAAQLEEMKREKERLEKEREQLAASIPASFLEPFMKIARQRNGVALVPVQEELCGGCHVRVMPKLIQQVRRATRLIACDSCHRFMYVPDDLWPKAAPGSDPPAP
jgi:predicted  nucleic acid-binding Zn-ribbon protein